MALPADSRLHDYDSDEELSDAQIQELLAEAERSLRMKQAGPKTGSAFKLPRLNEGHIADISLKTEGSVTRLDPSKLVRPEQKVLAEGIKKIEDPVQLQKQKLAVCFAFFSYSRCR